MPEMREIFDFEKKLIDCSTCDDSRCSVRMKFQRWPKACGGLGECKRLQRAYKNPDLIYGGQDEIRHT